MNYRTRCVSAIPRPMLKQIALKLGSTAVLKPGLLKDLKTVLDFTHSSYSEVKQQWNSRDFKRRYFNRESPTKEQRETFFILMELQKRSRCCCFWFCPDYKRHWRLGIKENRPCFTVDGLISVLRYWEVLNVAEYIIANKAQIENSHKLRHIAPLAKSILGRTVDLLSLLCYPDGRPSQSMIVLIDWNTLSDEQIRTVVRSAWESNVAKPFVVPKRPNDPTRYEAWEEFIDQQIKATDEGCPFVVGRQTMSAANDAIGPPYLKRLLIYAQAKKLTLLAVEEENYVMEGDADSIDSVQAGIGGDDDDDDGMDDDDDDEIEDEDDDRSDEIREEKRQRAADLFPYGAFDLEKDGGNNELTLAFLSCGYLTLRPRHSL